MAEATEKKKVGKLIAVIGIITVLLVFLGFIAYRIFWEFSNTAIQSYINQEAQKYSDPGAAATIIHDGVQHILDSRGLTKQLKDYASANNLSKEQAIVTAATAEAKMHNYIIPKNG